jgi:hypothetical protein
MQIPSRALALAGAVAAACVAAGTASAATSTFSGTVANGGCDAAHAVSVSAPSRIEITTSSTAQNPTNFYAEILAPDGTVIAGGSRAAYDTPSGGAYAVRVCSMYEEQSPPNQQYTALYGTGPAGQPVLTEPAQPQPATGGVLGATTSLSSNVSGKVAVRTRSGLAWFTLRSANAATTLRFVDPTHHGRTVVVKGLTATVSGSTIRITGHAVRLVLSKTHASFTSSTFTVHGKIARGHFQVKV